MVVKVVGGGGGAGGVDQIQHNVCFISLFLTPSGRLIGLLLPQAFSRRQRAPAATSSPGDSLARKFAFQSTLFFFAVSEPRYKTSVETTGVFWKNIYDFFYFFFYSERKWKKFVCQ